MSIFLVFQAAHPGDVLGTVDDIARVADVVRLTADPAGEFPVEGDDGSVHIGRGEQVGGLGRGMFYKRRDYTRIVDGTNPIVAHEFCGGSVEGMDVIVVDDMIASGGSMLDVARQLKTRGARRVFLFSTFGLFTSGMDRFDQAYAEGCFDRVFTTDLVYQSPELLKREYYYSVGMSRYVASLVDALHRGDSLAELVRPAHRIRQMLELYEQSHMPTEPA